MGTFREGLCRLMGKAQEPSLKDPAAFFSKVRAFTRGLDQIQVDTINAVLRAGSHWPSGWMAYGLGTAWGECKLRPIKERGLGDRDRDGEDDWFEKYDTGRLAAQLGNTPENDNDGGLYCGRGLVQLTGASNYAKAGLMLGVDLIRKPDLALQPDYAARILVWGMEGGHFTGRCLSDYFPLTGTGDRAEFVNARRIINGTDRKLAFADYAEAFQEALVAGGWE